MAGIYIHIPFCKQACYYCDFHFSTSSRLVPLLIDSIKKEITLRKHEITDSIETIYFGGGTPSVLSVDEINQILKTIYDTFNCSKIKEITFEANPDDLSDDYLKELKHSSDINRLSIGVQTFNNALLNKLNRAHDAKTAIGVINSARKIGFDNINLDIIFGLPGQTLKMLRDDWALFSSFYPEHISAYWLTIEEQTTFGKWENSGKMPSSDDTTPLIQWNWLKNKLSTEGIYQYEISNFSRNKKQSVHNSNYWKGKSYLGIGPSAHSFNKEERSWNISNNNQYIKSISKDILTKKKEQLDYETIINENIMIQLRMMDGINLTHFQNQFDVDLRAVNKRTINKYLATKHLRIINNTLKITPIGQQIVDQIASELFIIK